VAASLGDSLPESFAAVPQLIAGIQLDGLNSAGQTIETIETIRRILHLSLEGGRDTSAVLPVLGRLMKGRRYANLAVRALTSELLYAQTMLAKALGAGPGGPACELESFSDSTLVLLR